MAEEAVITPTEEAKDSKQGTVDEVLKETGSESVVAPQETPAEEPKKQTQETVPLAVYLELKDEIKTLKKDIKESAKSEQTKVTVEGIAELSQKYPDVSQEFIEDLLSSATKSATKQIEQKYTPILEKQENEKKQAEFDKAFNNLLESALKENPDIAEKVDRELIKTLAVTPKYRSTPISDIIAKVYGSSVEGKSSSENDTRSAADRVEDVVNFEKITDDQKKAVMADPTARKKYFDWLDTQTGR